jgi:hypothetical protein
LPSIYNPQGIRSTYKFVTYVGSKVYLQNLTSDRLAITTMTN